MTSLHHHHQQHHQEPNKTMQQHQATHQHGGMLLERRIIQLLTETNLTFKEIVIKLEGENLSATIGMIRRINRDNRYRRPRYDSKLTPSQRDSLVEELRDHKGMKPNLSLLAKRYGVCHGSVWYWWDKLNRIKRCDPMSRRGQVGGVAASTAAVAAAANGVGGKLCVGKTELQIFTANTRTYRRRPLKGEGLGGIGANQAAGSAHGMASALRWRGFNNILLDERYNYVGRVSIVGRNGGDSEQSATVAAGNKSVCCPIDLPILMFARKEFAEEDSVKTSVSSGSLDLSPSPVVVVDDSYEEDEGDEEEEEEEEDDEENDDEVDGLEFCDSRDGSSSLMMPLAAAAAASEIQQVGLASGSL